MQRHESVDVAVDPELRRALKLSNLDQRVVGVGDDGGEVGEGDDGGEGDEGDEGDEGGEGGEVVKGMKRVKARTLRSCTLPISRPTTRVRLPATTQATSVTVSMTVSTRSGVMVGSAIMAWGPRRLRRLRRLRRPRSQVPMARCEGNCGQLLGKTNALFMVLHYVT